MPRQLQNLLHFTLGLLTLFTFATAQANDRLALVVGNADYDARPLSNPVNDATAMKQRLEGLGFKVLFKTNADQGLLQEAFRQFLTEAPKHKIRLVYYSGHGAQVNETNYLLPVSPRIEYLDDLQRFGTSLNAVVDHLRGDISKVNIVVLDACRDNPYLQRPSRKKTKGAPAAGLSPMQAVNGTLIAYATAPGKVAYDGEGQFSPFTRRLLESISSPGLPIPLLFQQVTEDVHRDTKGQQSPWLTQSLVGGGFCFKPDAQGRCANTTVVRESLIAKNSLGHAKSDEDGTRTLGLFEKLLQQAESLFSDDMDEWLDRGNSGEPYSQTVLGRYYELKEPPSKMERDLNIPDYKWKKPKMLYWYKRAAKQGYAPALALLGQTYITGTGMGWKEYANPELAKHYLSQANTQSYPPAQYWLATLSLTPPDEAFQLHKAAAEGGYTPAMVSLASAYLFGKGTRVDPQSAGHWARQAMAEKGLNILADPPTQILAHLYRCRALQPANVEERLELDTLARELNQDQGMYPGDYPHVPERCTKG